VLFFLYSFIYSVVQYRRRFVVKLEIYNITLLVVETNCYYRQFLEKYDDKPSPECDKLRQQPYH